MYAHASLYDADTSALLLGGLYQRVKSWRSRKYQTSPSNFFLSKHNNDGL